MKKIFNLLSHFYYQIDKHNLFVLSGSLAFSLALAISPFLLLILIVLSSLGNHMQDQLILQSKGLFGTDAAKVIEVVIDNIDKNNSARGATGIISILIVAFSVSAIFSQLRSALDRISEYNVVQKIDSITAYIKERFFLIALLVGFIFLMISSLVINSILSSIMGEIEGFWWQTLNQTLSLFMFLFLFTVIFYFTPSNKRPIKDCILSGGIASLFFNIGKYLIGTYIGQSGVGSAYGAAGSFVVMLLWLYYSSLTFFISYEFSNDFVLEKSNR